MESEYENEVLFFFLSVFPSTIARCTWNQLHLHNQGPCTCVPAKESLFALLYFETNSILRGKKPFPHFFKRLKDKFGDVPDPQALQTIHDGR